MTRSIKIVKIGGNVINNPSKLKEFLKAFAALEGPKILVHGGGREATTLASALGIETTMIEGRRVTDASTLDVVTMVYAGLINKRIVAQLQALGCDSIGLCGADASIIRATRRPANPIAYGFVGDICDDGVDESEIANMLRNELVPVFCAITHDGEGQLLNCNADSVASAVACASSRIMPVNLIYCFERKGVLADETDDSSVISSITGSSFKDLKETEIVSGGMIPKIENALSAVKKGVKSVTIKAAEDLLNPMAGTTITL